jgi:hypothetical protein
MRLIPSCEAVSSLSDREPERLEQSERDEVLGIAIGEKVDKVVVGDLRLTVANVVELRRRQYLDVALECRVLRCH